MGRSTVPATETLSAVALQDVVVEIAGRRVLDGVTFPVTPGHVTALIGPSGAGKTLCVKFLAGILRPSGGRVLVGPRDMATLTPAQLRAYRRDLGVMFQGSMIYRGALFGSLNLFDNVAFPLRAVGDLPEEEILPRTWARLDEVGLAAHAEKMPSELSAGMVRRAALARALVADPSVLLLDDLDSGIDGVRLHGVARAVREARTRTGAAVLAVTHDPAFALEVADLIAVLRDGRIAGFGTPGEVLGGDARAFAFLAGDARGSELGMAREEVGPARLPREHDGPERLESPPLGYAVAALLIMVALVVAALAVAR